jgi:2-polyprenyl-3-methyl-5-hydroxy-6-metoxy-1,4-benzoquinol methylase
MAEQQAEITLADFQRYFPYTPAALCVKECARLSALRRYVCAAPILDVGCGDGLFASVAFEGAEVWGIDIDAREGRWAAASQAYSQVVLADVTRAKLPEQFFETCVANCSLEHVPRIDLAMQNIFSSLKPGGRVFMFVPNKAWAQQLLSYRFLSAIGASGLAATLQQGIDTFFRHEHLYDEEGWRKVLLDAGFEVEAVEPVLSSATTVAFEALLVPSLAGKLNKTLTTRWTNFPGARRALSLPVYALAKSLLDRNDQTPTAEFLAIGRRPDGNGSR